MEITIQYIISQVLVVIYYLIYTLTFQMKEKKKILYLGILATCTSAISYILLKAYLGMAMCVVAIIRNIIFQKSKSKKSLIIIILVTAILSMLTFSNVWCIFSVLATLTYTYALWKEKTCDYKKISILVNIFMIIYNISIKSIFGVIFMIIATCSSIIGLVRERNDKIYMRDFEMISFEQFCKDVEEIR